MNLPLEKPPGLDQPAIYRIQVQGVLPATWQTWFQGLELEDDGRITTFVGRIPDQPALFGHLLKIRDLGLTILSVNRFTED